MFQIFAKQRQANCAIFHLNTAKLITSNAQEWKVVFIGVQQRRSTHRMNMENVRQIALLKIVSTVNKFDNDNGLYDKIGTIY